MDAFQVDDNYVKSVAWKRWGLSMQRTGNEWHSGCPTCGGKDRFWVNALGHYQCRQCDTAGWLDEEDRKFRPDPLLLQHRAEWEANEKAEHEKSWRDFANGVIVGRFWQGWHDYMTEENIQWWLSQGITQQQIDYYELGYLPNKLIVVGNDKISVPAYTIPIHCPETWDIVNMHYRLAEPPAGVQKYRYEHGIPAREFYAEPGVSQKSAIVVEGAKKAMVVYDRIDAACQVIGLTSCTPSREMILRVNGYYSQIFLALDPGCERQEERFRKIVPHTRVVRLPDKPDDLMLAGATKDQLREYIRQSR